MCPAPVANQLILVQCCPFNNKTKCSWRETSCKYSKGVYVNQYFILSIKSMEMRWIVIIEKHLNDNPIKP